MIFEPCSVTERSGSAGQADAAGGDLYEALHGRRNRTPAGQAKDAQIAVFLAIDRSQEQPRCDAVGYMKPICCRPFPLPVPH